MAYWGVAMSYYDSLHEHPSDGEVELARQALQQAQSAVNKKQPRAGLHQCR